MTATEILEELINIGAIIKIGGSYHLTDVLDKLNKAAAEEGYVVLKTIETLDSPNVYPEPIASASKQKIVDVVLNYCEVPVYMNKGGSSFMVRSSDNRTLVNLLKIMKDPDLNPDIVLKIIKDYYVFIDYPKAFKRFIVEDFMSLYTYYSNGKALSETNGEIPDNTQWR